MLIKYFGIQGFTDRENLFDPGPSRPIVFGPPFLRTGRLRDRFCSIVPAWSSKPEPKTALKLHFPLTWSGLDEPRTLPRTDRLSDEPTAVITQMMNESKRPWVQTGLSRLRLLNCRLKQNNRLLLLIFDLFNKSDLGFTWLHLTWWYANFDLDLN